MTCFQSVSIDGITLIWKYLHSSDYICPQLWLSHFIYFFSQHVFDNVTKGIDKEQVISLPLASPANGLSH